MFNVRAWTEDGTFSSQKGVTSQFFSGRSWFKKGGSKNVPIVTKLPVLNGWKWGSRQGFTLTRQTRPTCHNTWWASLIEFTDLCSVHQLCDMQKNRSRLCDNSSFTSRQLAFTADKIFSCLLTYTHTLIMRRAWASVLSWKCNSISLVCQRVTTHCRNVRTENNIQRGNAHTEVNTTWMEGGRDW